MTEGLDALLSRTAVEYNMFCTKQDKGFANTCHFQIGKQKYIRPFLSIDVVINKLEMVLTIHTVTKLPQEVATLRLAQPDLVEQIKTMICHLNDLA